MMNSESRKREAERAQLEPLALVIHRLACTRCRMDWYCGGPGEDDVTKAAEVTTWPEFQRVLDGAR